MLKSFKFDAGGLQNLTLI